MKMYRLSSNWTLFYRLFLPTFWIVLVGAVVLTVWLLPNKYFGMVSASYLRAVLTSFYLTSLIIFYLTVIQFKRVEISKEELYVTNYFKHLKYPIQQVERITTTNYFVIKIGRVFLKEKGTFGSSFFFMISRTEFPIFWDLHPELKQEILR